MRTSIIETYYEPFQQKKSNGKRCFKENITYDYLGDPMQIECTDDNIGCTIEEAFVFSKSSGLDWKCLIFTIIF